MKVQGLICLMKNTVLTHATTSTTAHSNCILLIYIYSIKTVFWDQTLYSLVDRHQLFWENCHLQLNSRKSEEGTLNIKAYVCTDHTPSLPQDYHLKTHNWTPCCTHFLYLAHTLPLFHTTVKEFKGFVFYCYIKPPQHTEHVTYYLLPLF